MSLRNHMAVLGLRALRRIAALDADNLHEQLTSRPPRPSAPGELKGVSVTKATHAGLDVYTIAPPNPSRDHAVVYLHGGAYVAEINKAHWAFIRHLALAAGVPVHVPIYRLAPAATADQVVSEVTKAIIELPASSRTTLVGDSAGAGLALAVAQQAQHQFDRVLLISPWLDVRAADPRQQAIAPRDAMLHIDVVQAAGRLYAGELGGDHPLASPLFGPLEALPEIHVWTGTYDILNPEAHDLVERVRKADGSITLHEGPRMQHCWPLIPFTPEGRQAREQIVNLCR